MARTYSNVHISNKRYHYALEAKKKTSASVVRHIEGEDLMTDRAFRKCLQEESVSMKVLDEVGRYLDVDPYYLAGIVSWNIRGHNATSDSDKIHHAINDSSSPLPEDKDGKDLKTEIRDDGLEDVPDIPVDPEGNIIPPYSFKTATSYFDRKVSDELNKELADLLIPGYEGKENIHSDMLFKSWLINAKSTVNLVDFIQNEDLPEIVEIPGLANSLNENDLRELEMKLYMNAYEWMKFRLACRRAEEATRILSKNTNEGSTE